MSNATVPAHPLRPRSLLDALHAQPAVQGKAAPARARQRHALLDARRPQDPRRRGGAVVRERRTRPTRDHRGGRRASSRPWTTRRRSRWGIRRRSRSPTQLVKIAPRGLDHVFFTNSGSESVDTALKIALAYHRVRGEAHAHAAHRARARLSRRRLRRHLGGRHLAEPQDVVDLAAAGRRSPRRTPTIWRRTPSRAACPSTARSWPKSSNDSSRCTMPRPSPP